jgi:hypothetical protein
VSVDCGLQAPSPSSVERVFAEIAGFTVSEICPTDVDPTFDSQKFDGLEAGLVSQNGNLILRVLAGQLKSGGGDAFIHAYLGNLSTQTCDGVGVPGETEELGGACRE